MRSWKSWFALFLVAFSLSALAQEKLDQTTTAKKVIPGDVFFGLPNDEWDQFIICNGSMSPTPKFGSVPMKLAFVDSSGRVCHLNWLKDQVDSPESGLCELFCLFEKIGGYVFQAKEKCPNAPVPDDELSGSYRTTILLVSEDYLKTHTPLKVIKYPPKPLSKKICRKIEKTRGMKLRGTSNIATLENGSIYAVVWFETFKEKNIFSTVLISKHKLVFDDEEDDGEINWMYKGEANEDAFEILAAFKSSSGIDIARMTPGYEGLDSVFVRQNGAIFEFVAANAFYAGGF